MYDNVSLFYDSYGEREWERLESTAYGRIIYNCHMWFLSPHLKSGINILDAGCGCGRFSIQGAKNGCRMTLLDISKVQLDIAERKMNENGFEAYYINSSVTNMEMLPSNSFDIVICYGAVLNYLHTGLMAAMRELYRVAKHGGIIILSVNSRAGLLKSAASESRIPFNDFWGNPEKWGIYSVAETGEETDWPGASHPRRYFFTSNEIYSIMEKTGLSDIVLGSAPSVITGQKKNAEIASSDKTAWETLLYTENKMFTEPGLADAGEFILAKGIK